MFTSNDFVQIFRVDAYSDFVFLAGHNHWTNPLSQFFYWGYVSKIFHFTEFFNRSWPDCCRKPTCRMYYSLRIFIDFIEYSPGSVPVVLISTGKSLVSSSSAVSTELTLLNKPNFSATSPLSMFSWTKSTISNLTSVFMSLYETVSFTAPSDLMWWLLYDFKVLFDFSNLILLNLSKSTLVMIQHFAPVSILKFRLSLCTLSFVIYLSSPIA